MRVALGDDIGDRRDHRNYVDHILDNVDVVDRGADDHNDRANDRANDRDNDRADQDSSRDNDHGVSHSGPDRPPRTVASRRAARSRGCLRIVGGGSPLDRDPTR